jgi:hypothetical protein
VSIKRLCAVVVSARASPSERKPAFLPVIFDNALFSMRLRDAHDPTVFVEDQQVAGKGVGIEPHFANDGAGL